MSIPFSIFSTFSTSALPAPDLSRRQHELQLPETVRSSYRNAKKLLRSANKERRREAHPEGEENRKGENQRHRSRLRRTIRRRHTEPIAKTVSKWAARRQLPRKGKRDNLLRRAKKIPPKRDKKSKKTLKYALYIMLSQRNKVLSINSSKYCITNNRIPN